MVLIRPIRRPLPKPTGELLRKVMREYALQRHVVARLMRVSKTLVDCYLRPQGNKYWKQIPLGRWELLLLKVRAMFHPDEDFELSP